MTAESVQKQAASDRPSGVDVLQDNQPDSPESVPSPVFFGRQEELNQLNSLLEGCRERTRGYRWLVSLHSLPGMGKKTLLDQWRRQLIQRGISVITLISNGSLNQWGVVPPSSPSILPDSYQRVLTSRSFLEEHRPVAEFLKREVTSQTVVIVMETVPGAGAAILPDLAELYGGERANPFVVLSTIRPERLTDYVYLRMRAEDFPLGPMRREDLQEWMGEERGRLLYQLTGGYPAAVAAISGVRSLKAGDLQVAIRNPQSREAKILASFIWSTLEKEGVWRQAGIDPEEKNPISQAALALLLTFPLNRRLSVSEVKTHLQESGILQRVGLNPQIADSTLFEIIGKAGSFLEWKAASSDNGSKCGYQLIPPFDAIFPFLNLSDVMSIS